MHQDTLEFFCPLVGRHLSHSLVTMAESYLVELLLVWFPVHEHLQPPPLVILRSYGLLDRGLEHDFLEYIEMTRIVFEIFLKLGL